MNEQDHQKTEVMILARPMSTLKKTHQCDLCGSTFKYACRLRQHQERKTPCIPSITHETNPTRPHCCQFCGKGFGTPQGKYQHKRYCPFKPLDVSLGSSI